MPFVPFFRLLVGAPRADARQPGVHKGGAVYKCPALRAGGCEIIPFDKGGKQKDYKGYWTKMAKI